VNHHATKKSNMTTIQSLDQYDAVNARATELTKSGSRYDDLIGRQQLGDDLSDVETAELAALEAEIEPLFRAMREFNAPIQARVIGGLSDD